jgi:hypothetical protein
MYVISVSRPILLLILPRITTRSSKLRSAHRSILKHGRQACSNTTSANHISLRPYPPATFARSCRTRSLHQGEGLRTSDTKSLRREEALLMSGKTVRHRHVQRTLSARQAALATTVSPTASRVWVVRCLYPCDLRHQRQMARIRGPSQEGRRSTADCPLPRAGCTATCNSQLFFVRVEHSRTPSFTHVWIVLGISGVVCACTACTHSSLAICGGLRHRREYGLEQFIEASPPQHHHPFFQRFTKRNLSYSYIAYHWQSRLGKRLTLKLRARYLGCTTMVGNRTQQERCLPQNRSTRSEVLNRLNYKQIRLTPARELSVLCTSSPAQSSTSHHGHLRQTSPQQPH